MGSGTGCEAYTLKICTKDFLTRRAVWFYRLTKFKLHSLAQDLYVYLYKAIGVPHYTAEIYDKAFYINSLPYFPYSWRHDIGEMSQQEDSQQTTEKQGGYHATHQINSLAVRCK